jgi:hypothetical protein
VPKSSSRGWMLCKSGHPSAERSAAWPCHLLAPALPAEEGRDPPPLVEERYRVGMELVVVENQLLQGIWGASVTAASAPVNFSSSPSPWTSPPSSHSPCKLGPRAVLCSLFFSGCSALYLPSTCLTQEDRLSSGPAPSLQETKPIASFLSLLSRNRSLGYHQPHAVVGGGFQPG